MQSELIVFLFAHVLGVAPAWPIQADLQTVRSWQIEGTQTQRRWIEIHRVEDSGQSKLYHVEILGREIGSPIWDVVHLVPHMAVTEAAIRKSARARAKERAVYPETFDDAYGK